MFTINNQIASSNCFKYYSYKKMQQYFFLCRICKEKEDNNRKTLSLTYFPSGNEGVTRNREGGL